MRFGGHETFAIREGWLHKGAKLLIEHPDRLTDDNAAEWLGVGRNMAKSINYWLVATGLATGGSVPRGGKPTALEPTPFARLVWKHDPFFAESGTWWALHINLVNSPEHSAAWAWFFNHLHLHRFERSLCVDAFQRHLHLTERRLPAATTIQRDVACLLSSYAREIPPERVDPEEGNDCPFVEMGLLTHHRSSGYYQLHDHLKAVSPYLIGYSFARSLQAAGEGEGTIDVTLHEAVRLAGGPGRAFVFSAEALFEAVIAAESHLSHGDLKIAGLAGERLVRLRRRSPLDWLRAYYQALAKGAADAA